MKRYKCNPTVTRHEDQFSFRREVKIQSIMEESSDGEWVRWKDVEALREFLENQIPDKRIAKLERALGLVNAGKCPECEQVVRGWEPPLGVFAPEMFATLSENGIDPGTGHKVSCKLKRSDHP